MRYRKDETRSVWLRRRLVWVFGWAASLVLSGWAQHVTPAPAPPEPQANFSAAELQLLIQLSDHNGAKQHQRLAEYTYLQRRTTRELGPKGKVVEAIREYEAYPVKRADSHQHVLSLIKKDGVPVSAAQLEQNRLAAVREMEQAEAETQRPAPAHRETAKYITAGIGLDQTSGGIWLGVSQFLRQCQFAAPRRTLLNGRATLILALHACQVPPTNAREAYLNQLVGLVWLDEVDKVVTRLEAWPGSRTLAPAELWAARPSAEVLVYEQQLLREGVWAPRRIRLNGLGQGRFFNGVDKDMLFEFTDYRHFATDVKEKELTEPVKKPVF